MRLCGYSQTAVHGEKPINMIQLQKEIITQPEIKLNIVGFEVTSAYDDRLNKIVTANVNLIDTEGRKYDKSGIIVWYGEAYDLAGQWTDSDLEQALLTLI